MSKTPFTSTDALIASAIAGVTIVLVAGILLSAEQVKRDSAASIVGSVAAANRKRLEAGKPAVAGRIDDASILVTEGEVEAQEWDNLPYSFSGAESTRDPCILAVATRRTDGRWGTQSNPYRAWGVCSSAKGETAPFEGDCPLDCREPEPPPPPVVTPAATPTPVAPTPTPTRRIKAPLVEAPMLAPDKPVKPKGCSVTGCFGTTCCDSTTDSCMPCPGSSCCTTEKLGCNGICHEEDDCTIGCGCVKLPGSPTGNCRAK